MRGRLVCLTFVFLAAGCGPEGADVGGLPPEELATEDSALTFAMQLSPGSVTLPRSGSATIEVAMTASGHSTRHWTLSASGLRAGVTASFDVPVITAGMSSTLTLSASGSAALGADAFTITASSSGSYRETAKATVTVVTASSSGVGPKGGTVSRLHFGLSGDTRPPNCGDTANYPSPVIEAISDALKARNAQFVVDLGDHMYVCDNSTAVANTQMDLFTSAARRFPGTWFMTMGNHECSHTPCLEGSTNANYVSYMAALAPVAQKPYYAFDVSTGGGLARFVIVADNAWSSAQAAWLEATLKDADTAAKYTIVVRHHPENDTSLPTLADSMGIIRGHKFTLLLTGHSHLYRHGTADEGRDLVLGIGGAPLASGGSFNGYAMVDQQTNGELKVSVYNLNGDALVDQWSVPPNP